MLIFVAENGRSFELECDDTTLVGEIQSQLFTLTGIQEKQQMLICNGSKLDPTRLLSSYRAPREMEIFLFNRSRLLPNSSPPSDDDVPEISSFIPQSPSLTASEHPLDKSNNPLLRALPSYERQFDFHLQKANAFISISNSRFETCKKILNELIVQERAIEAASGNMGSYYDQINTAHRTFLHKYEDYLSRSNQSISNFEKDLDNLNRIKLPNQLCQKYPTPLSFLNEQCENGLRKSASECSAANEKLHSRVKELKLEFQKLNADVQHLLNTIPEFDVRKLQKSLIESAKIMEEQVSIAQSLSKDLSSVRNVLNGNDRKMNDITSSSSSSLNALDACNAFDPMNSIHESVHLPRIQSFDKTLTLLMQNFVNSKKSMTIYVHNKLKKVAILQSKMRQLQIHQHVLHDATCQQENHLQEILIPSKLRGEYELCLSEIKRRKTFRVFFHSKVEGMIAKMQGLCEKETEKRKFFTSRISILPLQFIMDVGLNDFPTFSNVVIVPFDSFLIQMDSNEFKDDVSFSLDAFLHSNNGLWEGETVELQKKTNQAMNRLENGFDDVFMGDEGEEKFHMKKEFDCILKRKDKSEAMGVENSSKEEREEEREEEGEGEGEGEMERIDALLLENEKLKSKLSDAMSLISILKSKSNSNSNLNLNSKIKNKSSSLSSSSFSLCLSSSNMNHPLETNQYYAGNGDDVFKRLVSSLNQKNYQVAALEKSLTKCMDQIKRFKSTVRILQNKIAIYDVESQKSKSQTQTQSQNHSVMNQNQSIFERSQNEKDKNEIMNSIGFSELIQAYSPSLTSVHHRPPSSLSMLSHERNKMDEFKVKEERKLCSDGYEVDVIAENEKTERDKQITSVEMKAEMIEEEGKRNAHVMDACDDGCLEKDAKDKERMENVIVMNKEIDKEQAESEENEIKEKGEKRKEERDEVKKEMVGEENDSKENRMKEEREEKEKEVIENEDKVEENQIEGNLEEDKEEGVEEEKDKVGEENKLITNEDYFIMNEDKRKSHSFFMDTFSNEFCNNKIKSKFCFRGMNAREKRKRKRDIKRNIKININRKQILLNLNSNYLTLDYIEKEELISKFKKECEDLKQSILKREEEMDIVSNDFRKSMEELESFKSSNKKFIDLLKKMIDCITYPSESPLSSSSTPSSLSSSLSSSSSFSPPDCLPPPNSPPSFCRILSERLKRLIFLLSRNKVAKSDSNLLLVKEMSEKLLTLVEECVRKDELILKLKTRLKETTNMLTKLVNKHEQEKQLCRTKASLENFCVGDRAAFVLNSEGRYEAVNRFSPNFFLSPHTFSTLQAHKPTLPPYILGIITGIKACAMESDGTKENCVSLLHNMPFFEVDLNLL